MTGKSVRDVDRYQAVLANLLLEEENKYCADCQAKGNTRCLESGGEGRLLVVLLEEMQWRKGVCGSLHRMTLIHLREVG